MNKKTKAMAIIAFATLLAVSGASLKGFSFGDIKRGVSKVGSGIKKGAEAVGGGIKKAAVTVGGKIYDCARVGVHSAEFAAAKTAETAAKGALAAAEGAMRVAEGATYAAEGTLKGARGTLRGAQAGFNAAQKGMELQNKALNLAKKAADKAADIASNVLGGPVKIKKFYAKVVWVPGSKITSNELEFEIVVGIPKIGDVTINTKEIMDIKKDPLKFAEKIGKMIISKVT